MYHIGLEFTAESVEFNKKTRIFFYAFTFEYFDIGSQFMDIAVMNILLSKYKKHFMVSMMLQIVNQLK